MPLGSCHAGRIEEGSPISRTRRHVVCLLSLLEHFVPTRTYGTHQYRFHKWALEQNILEGIHDAWFLKKKDGAGQRPEELPHSLTPASRMPTSRFSNIFALAHTCPQGMHKALIQRHPFPFWRFVLHLWRLFCFFCCILPFLVSFAFFY